MGKSKEIGEPNASSVKLYIYISVEVGLVASEIA